MGYRVKMKSVIEGTGVCECMRALVCAWYQARACRCACVGIARARVRPRYSASAGARVRGVPARAGGKRECPRMRVRLPSARADNARGRMHVETLSVWLRARGGARGGDLWYLVYDFGRGAGMS